MDSLVIATTQFELRAETDVEEYLQHMEGLVIEAVAKGADVILFPELASTGLLGSITDRKVTTETITSDYWNVLTDYTDSIVDGLIRMARTYGIVIVGGSHNRLDESGSLRNTAFTAFPDGSVLSQDKIHLTPQEHQLGITGGDQLITMRLGNFTAGVLICADIQFPELTRHLVSLDVDLVLCPSLTWNRRGVHRVRTGCQARAIENQLYVVMSPLIGSSGLPADAPLHAVGKAVVTGPVDKTVGSNDGILAEADSGVEEIVMATLDPDLIWESRANPEAPGLKLRRLDLYETLNCRAQPGALGS